jgi:hypothetical protein
VLLWFVSALLTLAYEFPDTELTDVSIDSEGTVWLLPVSDPAIIRLYPDGEIQRFETGNAGLSTGLAISSTGDWLLPDKAGSVILRYNADDIITEVIPVSNPGDVLFSGLSIWCIDTMRGDVVSTSGGVIARDCGGRNSRLCGERSGRSMISGPEGVFLIQEGETAVKIAETGSACFSSRGILILSEGVLRVYGGDTLETDLLHTRISASPDGGMVVLWGGTSPLVLE